MHRRHRLIALTLALLLPGVPALAQYQEDGAALEPLSTLDPALEQTLRLIDSHLGFLASDELGGRDTATLQGHITARYVASVFQGAGLEPAGEGGTFLQRFPLVSSRLDVGSVVFELTGEQPRRFVVDEEFAIGGYGGDIDLSAGVVFVGHGLIDAEAGVDDYAGLDVKGKVVLAIGGRPEGRDDLRRAASWRTKRKTAEEQGAAALLLVPAPGDEPESQALRHARTSMHVHAMTLPKEEDDDSAFPRIYGELVVGQALFVAAGLDFEAECERREKAAGLPGFALEGVQVHLAASVVTEELGSDNVAGLIPGSDPVLGQEIVVVSAHMDHVGIGKDGDVFNGADDNASGTTGLLVLAERLGRLHAAPKRSVLLLAVSAEEKGLLGSEWWVAHPTVDLKQVVADINVDMIGRNDPASIGITPSDQHSDYNSMVPLAQRIGGEVGLSVGWHAGEGRFRKLVDDYYSRSDHVHFAEAGIPVVFLFSGEHEDYHKPTDTLDKLDRHKIAKVIDLVEGLAREVADAPERPVKLAR